MQRICTNFTELHNIYRTAQTCKTLFQLAYCIFFEVTLASSLPSMVDDADSESSDTGSLDESRASMPWSEDIDGDCQGDLSSKGERHNSALASSEAL